MPHGSEVPNSLGRTTEVDSARACLGARPELDSCARHRMRPGALCGGVRCDPLLRCLDKQASASSRNIPSPKDVAFGNRKSWRASMRSGVKRLLALAKCASSDVCSANRTDMAECISEAHLTADS